MVTQRGIRDLETTLQQIVRAAVETVPGADAGGISLTDGTSTGSRAPTNPTISDLDHLQAELDEGPRVTAITEPPADGVVHATDLSRPPDAERWPTFAPRAVSLGYRSLLSNEMVTDHGIRAALNLYSHRPRAFDDRSRILAGLFSVQAGMLLYGAEHVSQMDRALRTRDTIGQAKGVLMERFDIDEDEAFRMLVGSSQDTNLKLAGVARWLTDPASRRLSRPDPA